MVCTMLNAISGIYANARKDLWMQVQILPIIQAVNVLRQKVPDTSMNPNHKKRFFFLANYNLNVFLAKQLG